MKDLKEKAIRGGVAKVCAQAATFCLRIGSLMVLARLLDPKDFGLVGMVTAVIGVLNLFRDFGLSTATVQRTTVTEEQISTLFWINVLVGAILAVVSMAMAPVIVAFYHEPRLFWITTIASTGFLFNAAGVQHSALLEREMQFSTLAGIDIVSLVGSSAVGISMALLGSGYWALVMMTAASPLISTTCLWLKSAWLPGRPHKNVGMRSMMQFGGTVTLNGLVVYAAYNLEKVLMGRFWGAEIMGIYGRAYQLITIPTDNLNSAVSGVAFSALSRVKEDRTLLTNYFLKGYSLILALTTPATLFCAFFADDLIHVLLGAKWAASAAIFRLLAPTVLVLACINPFYWLLVSLGMIKRSLKMAFVIAPLVVTAYLIGFHYGPKGVAFAYSTAMVLWLLPHIAWSVRGTSISFFDIIRAITRPFLSGLIAAMVAVGGQHLYGQILPPLGRLIVGGLLLLGAYSGVLLYVMEQKTFYVNLLRSLRSRQSPDQTLVPA